MNSWVKYAPVIMAVVLFANCNATKNGTVDGHKIHKIDSLPPTIIAPVNADDNSILHTDTTTQINKYEIDNSIVSIESLELETINFPSEKALNLNNKGLANIIFEDLKIAVDDYRNNNYLNPDF